MSYEVLAVRYGTRKTVRSEVYLNYHAYGEPDTEIRMDYFFWVIRDERHLILVDTGFSREAGARRGRTMLAEPAALLADLGIDAAQVSQILITHAHYDHIGGLPAFPAAEVVMAEQEYAFWTGPVAARPLYAHSAEPAEIRHLAAVHAAGRLTLFASSLAVGPGVEMVEVGGHTPGQAIVLVDTAAGQVVLASDALHYYEEAERDRPFSVVSDLAAMYRSFDLLRELGAAPGSRLVAGHDPAVRERFAAEPGHSLITRVA